VSTAQAFSGIWIRDPSTALDAAITATDLVDAGTKWAPTAQRNFDPRTAESSLRGCFEKTNILAFGINIDVTSGGNAGWTTAAGLNTDFLLPMSDAAETGVWFWEIDVPNKTFRLVSPLVYQGFRALSGAGPHTLTVVDREVTIDTSGGARVIYVPQVNPGAVWSCLIKKITTDVNAITIQRNAFAGNIEAVAGTFTWALSVLTNYPEILLFSDGTDYWVAGIHATATTVLSGLVELATPTEVRAGTDDTRATTSEGVASAIKWPASRVVSASSGAIGAADIGNVINVTTAGACEIDLPEQGVVTDKIALITIQCWDSATALTISPDAENGVTIDGGGAAFVAPVGRARVCLMSMDGLAWAAPAAPASSTGGQACTGSSDTITNTTTDGIVTVNPSGNYTLTTPATIPAAGWHRRVQKIAANAYTILIDLGGVYNINGASADWTWALSGSPAYPYIDIWSDGSGLYVG
jgi:hypothetical protein